MNLFMFRAVPLPIIRSSLTVHLALVYVMRFEDSFRAVNELLMMGRGTARNMKRFIFLAKINLGN
jgi:hypothetical protein